MNWATNIVHVDTVEVCVNWFVKYEPVESIPVVQSSLVGDIYNGGQISRFSVVSDLIVFDDPQYCASGIFDDETGVIIIFYDQKPHEDHYLCVAYEIKSVNHDWLQEGF